jgi:hypothetical protein
MAKEKSKEARVVRVYLYENNMEELKGTYYARLAQVFMCLEAYCNRVRPHSALD